MKFFHKSKHLAIFFILVWIIGAGFLLEFGPRLWPSTTWDTITNSQFNMSIDYPTKWRAHIYDENGYRGVKTTKLKIYRSLIDQLVITVKYQSKVSPTLEDVQQWGNDLVLNANRFRADNNEPLFQELDFQSSSLNGKSVIRQTYSDGNVRVEYIYIARQNDMIIILIQAGESEFEQNSEDFEKILASFRPLN